MPGMYRQRREQEEKYCSKCKTLKPNSAFSVFMRRSIYSNETRKCEEYIDDGDGKKFCSTCQASKELSSFSNKMRKASCYNDESRECQDCASPVCTYPSCKTCKACRDPDCKKRKNCQEEVFVLNPKHVPKTKAEVDNFRCSNCPTLGKKSST